MKYKKTSKSPLCSDCFSPDLTYRRDARLFETVAFFFALFFLAIFPLLISSSGYANITETKFKIFWIMTVVFIGICLLCALRYCNVRFRNNRRREGIILPTLPQLFVLAFMLWSSLSALLSEYGADTWIGQNRYEGLFSILMYGSIFLLLSFWGEFSDKYVFGICITAFLLGLIATLQSFGSSIMFPDGYNYYTGDESRFFATIGHQDCFSGMVSTLVPVLFCSFVLLKDKRRFYCLPGMILMFYVQLFCDVDSGKLGLLAALVVTLPFLIETRERLVRFFMASAGLTFAFMFHALLSFESNGTVHASAGKTFWLFLFATILLIAASVLLPRLKWKLGYSPKKIRIITLIVIAVLVIVALVFLFFYSGNNKLLTEMSQMLHGQLADTAGSCRGYLWKTAVALIKEQPIIGSGPGTFLSRFNPYTLQYNVAYGIITQWEADTYSYGDKQLVTADFAHNDFLQIGVCVGIVGLALYLAFIISLAIRAFKAAKRSPEVILLIGGIAGYLVHSFFAFSIAIVTPVFWAMAGILDHCIRQIPKEEKETV